MNKNETTLKVYKALAIALSNERVKYIVKKRAERGNNNDNKLHD